MHQGQIWAKTQQLEFIINALAQAPSLRVVDANGANLLTKREEDLVHLVADGLGNRNIAQQLLGTSADQELDKQPLRYSECRTSVREQILLRGAARHLIVHSIETRLSVGHVA